MNNVKYVGLDVHQASVTAAVLNQGGKCIAQAVIETKASTIKEFISGWRITGGRNRRSWFRMQKVRDTADQEKKKLVGARVVCS